MLFSIPSSIENITSLIVVGFDHSYTALARI